MKNKNNQLTIQELTKVNLTYAKKTKLYKYTDKSTGNELVFKTLDFDFSNNLNSLINSNLITEDDKDLLIFKECVVYPVFIFEEDFNYSEVVKEIKSKSK